MKSQQNSGNLPEHLSLTFLKRVRSEEKCSGYAYPCWGDEAPQDVNLMSVLTGLCSENSALHAECQNRRHRMGSIDLQV